MNTSKNTFIIQNILKKNNPNIIFYVKPTIIPIDDQTEIPVITSTVDDQTEIPVITSTVDDQTEIPVITSTIDDQTRSQVITHIIETIPSIIITSPSAFLEHKHHYTSYNDFIKSNPNYIYNHIMYNRLLAKKNL